jgi:large subunit ribosomal protein L22
MTNGNPTAVAHLRFVRTGPRKLRRVADAIRGKSVREALVMLKFADVFAAEPIEKLVRSAVANAGNNHDMNTDDLYIAKITVDGGPGGRFTKRLDPRDGRRQRAAAGEAAPQARGSQRASGPHHAPGVDRRCSVDEEEEHRAQAHRKSRDRERCWS